ncbi:MAG TPA: ATP-grasp domain-containing protein [candidate division Zixibacteria bacterium]|nr:ATP-grasp domain-containing protein [candidate division Zixibacteria bacterium]
MKLLVVGFNARPIAKSAKNAGYDLGVVDYFGDIDLFKLTSNCFTVLRQKPGNTLHRILHRSPPEYLYILSEVMIDEQGDFDGIILGSAFDRYPELIQQFSKLGPKLYSNTPEKFTKVRDIKQIQEIALKSGFKVPKTIVTKSTSDLIEIAKNHTYPLVSRSGGGGGGFGIKKWNNFEELKEFFNEKEIDIEKEYWIQEYIEGVDASASIICSKDQNHIISINQQIIGDRNLYSPSDFSYCGNIVPLRTTQTSNEGKLQEKISSMIQDLFSKLDLIGSNGIDFVIKNDNIYFMEINPRIQGSIECLEYATGLNLMDLHISACEGKKLDLPSIPHYKRIAIKGILFSGNEQPIQVNQYPKNRWIVDRTHYNIFLEKGDPFCSIVMPVSSQEKGYNKMIKIAKKIIKMNQRKILESF